MMRKKLVTCTSTKKIGDIVTNSQLNMDSDREVTDIKTENLDEPDYLTTDMLDDIIGNKIDMNDCEMSERYTENKSATDTDKVPSVGVNLKKETNTTCNMKLNRIKPEQVKTENYDKCNLMTEVVEHIKKEDGEVMVKIEEAQLKAYVDKKEPYDDMDSIQLTEELDIKVDNDASTEKTSSPVSIRYPKMKENRKLNPSRNFLSCDKCRHTTQSKNDLIKHMEIHAKYPNRNFTCKHCNHIIKDHDYIGEFDLKVYTCKQCYYKSVESSAYEKTIRDDVTKDVLVHSDRILTFNRCSLCNEMFKFKNKISFDNHIIIHHLELMESVTSEIHKCRFCTHKTTMIDMLPNHMLTHVEDPSRELTCKHCSKMFKSQISTDNYIIEDHDYTREISHELYTCRKCAHETVRSSYSTDYLLERHKDHICSLYCNKTYTRKK